MKDKVIELAKRSGAWEFFEAHETNEGDVEYFERFYCLVREQYRREIGEPLAWMYEDDAKQFRTNEMGATVWSIKVGNPNRGTTDVPLYQLPKEAE